MYVYVLYVRICKSILYVRIVHGVCMHNVGVTHSDDVPTDSMCRLYAYIKYVEVFCFCRDYVNLANISQRVVGVVALRYQRS